MDAYLRTCAAVLPGWFRAGLDLVIETAASRQQSAMYERRRPQTCDSDRLFWIWLACLWPGWRDVLIAVRPETVVRWHRVGWCRYWTWKSRSRRPGRPQINLEARALIMRLARENPCWGAARTRGAACSRP
jgi:hypothetical protein